MQRSRRRHASPPTRLPACSTCHARAQASANTLTAHLVSIVFLTFLVRKVTSAYQRVLEMGEQLSKSFGGLKP
jgi:hypothetical protein